MRDEDRAAVAAFPQLRRLIELRDRPGWALVPDVADGQVVRVRGLHLWPQGYADAFLLRSLTDAAALRCDHTGGVVWRRDGGLVDVLDALLALPAPDTPAAPRLVIATAPPRLWTR